MNNCLINMIMKLDKIKQKLKSFYTLFKFDPKFNLNLNVTCFCEYTSQGSKYSRSFIRQQIKIHDWW